MDKEEVQSCCRQLFGKYGVHAITMDDISRQLAMSKKTLYKLYPNKEAIVVEYIHRVINDIRKQLDEATRQGHSSVHRLQLFTDTLITIILSGNRIIYFNIQRHYPKGYALLQRLREELTKQLCTLIQQGQQEGVFQCTLDAQLLAELQLRELEWVLLDQQMTDSNAQIVLQQTFKVFLQGILTATLAVQPRTWGGNDSPAPPSSKVLLFTTNLCTITDVHRIAPALDTLNDICQWTVDVSDSDKVLRIVASNDITQQVKHQLKQHGYKCQPMFY